MKKASKAGQGSKNVWAQNVKPIQPPGISMLNKKSWFDSSFPPGPLFFLIMNLADMKGIWQVYWSRQQFTARAHGNWQKFDTTVSDITKEYYNRVRESLTVQDCSKANDFIYKITESNANLRKNTWTQLLRERATLLSDMIRYTQVMNELVAAIVVDWMVSLPIHFVTTGARKKHEKNKKTKQIYSEKIGSMIQNYSRTKCTERAASTLKGVW